jgi:hypothetical protein
VWSGHLRSCFRILLPGRDDNGDLYDAGRRQLQLYRADRRLSGAYDCLSGKCDGGWHNRHLSASYRYGQLPWRYRSLLAALGFYISLGLYDGDLHGYGCIG